MAEKTATAAIQALRGMKDVLPDEARYYQFVEAKARELFELYDYREIRTPVLEATELFSRSVGEASDIVVSKQMYTFADPGERMNTLRPEGTAGVVRALVESGRFKETAQQKVYYIGPMFRFERPQKGRLRQFSQLGVEFFGVANPAADAEVIALCDSYLRALGFRDVSTKLNNVGCRDCRKAYNDILRESILGGTSEMSGAGWCEDCIRRAEINPMRVFDCKVESCRALVAKLPRISDHVCEACRAHFDAVLSLLDALSVPHETDRELVRGLDYYTRTVFEVVQGGLGAQNAVLGGGRYDDLVAELGGPATPAVGMSVGIERMILAMQANKIEPPAERSGGCYILALDEAALAAAAKLAHHARAGGVLIHFDCQPKSAKAGLKSANRVGAKVAVIIGSDELSRSAAQWKNLETSEQVELPLVDVQQRLLDGQR